VDDAISLQRIEGGFSKIWIHISDVSRWVSPSSQLFLEAERRMTSVYFSDEIISMFPPLLSQGLLSLGAREESCALSCGVMINEEGKVLSAEVFPSKIRLTKKLTYIQLDRILHGDDVTDLHLEENVINDFLELERLTSRRGIYRKEKNAALDSYFIHKTELSLTVKVDEKNENESKTVILSEVKYGNSKSICLVAECMIMMCDRVGAICSELNAEVLYKIQIPQNTLKITDLDLLPNETLFHRSNRIIRFLKAASDSKTEGMQYYSLSSSTVCSTRFIHLLEI
jgi:exoribonuclease R